jgi:hypothetical protein
MYMSLDNYIADAVRTESQLDTISTNKEVLLAVLRLSIASGNLLDMVKKEIFYGKPIDQTRWWNYLCDAETQMHEIEDGSFEVPVQDCPEIGCNTRLLHSAIGISTEGAELLEAMVSHLTDGTPIDEVNFREEIFDTMWYGLIAHDAMRSSIDKTLIAGFNKLRARYPDKFTSEDAINRDLDVERAILEQ